MRGGVGHGQQGVHARGAERRARVPDGVTAAHAHGGREFRARARHRAGEFFFIKKEFKLGQNLSLFF